MSIGIKWISKSCLGFLANIQLAPELLAPLVLKRLWKKVCFGVNYINLTLAHPTGFFFFIGVQFRGLGCPCEKLDSVVIELAPYHRSSNIFKIRIRFFSVQQSFSFMASSPSAFVAKSICLIFVSSYHKTWFQSTVQSSKLWVLISVIKDKSYLLADLQISLLEWRWRLNCRFGNLVTTKCSHLLQISGCLPQRNCCMSNHPPRCV